MKRSRPPSPPAAAANKTPKPPPLKHIPAEGPINRTLLIDKVNVTTSIGKNRPSTILHSMLTFPLPPSARLAHQAAEDESDVVCVDEGAGGGVRDSDEQ